MLTLEQFRNKKMDEAMTSADHRTARTKAGLPARPTAYSNKEVEKMAKDRKYKGNTSGLERALRKYAGRRFDNNAFIQKVIKKHAETNEAVTSADRTPQNVTGSDGKVRTRMVPTTKKSDTSEVYARPKGKVTVLKKGVPASDSRAAELLTKGYPYGSSSKKAKQNEAANPHDDEGANHIIMQLRKSVSLRGMRPVEFKDGKKVKVSMADAQKFLTKYNKSKPMDKEKMQAMAMKSHDGFKKALSESVQEDMSDFERRMRMMRQAGSSQKINQKKRDDKEKKSMAAKAAVDMRARRNEVKEDRMAGKYKKGQTIVRGQWPNPDKWAEEYIMPNADKKGVRIYSNGPAFVIEKL